MNFTDQCLKEEILDEWGEKLRQIKIDNIYPLDTIEFCNVTAKYSREKLGTEITILCGDIKLICYRTMIVEHLKFGTREKVAYKDWSVTGNKEYIAELKNHLNSL